MKKDDGKQLKDIFDLRDSSLQLVNIESIATDDDARKHFESEYKGHLYSKILLLLTHESYEENEAKSLWNNILRHLRDLNHKLGRNVGVSVATLDYLSNIRNKLSTPVIIEEDKSEFVSSTTTKDELTGLYLRAVFDVVLEQSIEEANRDNTALCLLMIDIDDFKTINDTYGHLEGDHVLKKLGTAITDFARKMDFPARYGGEEFVIVMPNTEKKQAFKAAERIRKKVAKLTFKKIPVTISISIGLSQTSHNLNTPDKLIHAADTALYAAKDKGKNCVVVFEEAD